MFKALFVIILTTLLSACCLYSKATSLPDCDSSLAHLLLEENDFPPNWKKGRSEQYAQFGAIDSCIVTFYVLNGVANQEIYKYEDEERASNGYLSYLDAYALKAADTVPAPSFESSKADNYYLACAIDHKQQFCKMVGRYKNIVVVFTSYIGPFFMTQDDFERILSVIDEKMSAS
jgi:hypothetical protein